ncbi:MAG: undecaprenyl/decaprenyl-phosphate alpha-N-acetylglucosaminyl 1-phosphate transferase [Anaerolineae bacterium]|nr:undecaprenyl/decaprenyl-phosphate alpha-N-acetylglucosaminyl 1-phosphate transferase [Anaerolineae bacterium]
MSVVIVVFGGALFLALIGTQAMRKVAFRLDLISIPRADRAHQEPTAMMGGVAIYLGATVALLLGSVGASVLLKGWKNLDELAGILAGATIMGAIGLWDDRVRLNPVMKLLPQFLAAAFPILTGVYIQLPIPMPLNIALTVCWMLYVTNGVNFSDNMDGVAGGISAVASAFFTVIAAMNGQYLVSALSAALTGACLGFLRYNLPLPRAQIFMGDAGALFLGFMLANLGIKLRFPDNVNFVTWMVPVLVLGVPLFDTTMVFISRFRRRISPLQGGIDHTSHRLSRLGLGSMGATLALDLIGGAFGIIAIFVMQASVIEGYLIAGLIFALACYALWKLDWRLDYRLRVGQDNQGTRAVD